ncbi:MAG: ketopantoate reductase family protein [Novosphingobium sp.]
MARESVLIVGAGALGIVTGYHLQLAGADIAFLVRPGRLAALADPQVLYCFDDHQLKHFTGYKAHGSVAEAKAAAYDFVIVTMDGATCRGEEATALLAELGDAIRNSNAYAVISGVGVRDYCRDVMKLPDERVVEGTMGLLSYQTDRVELPLNPPTDAAKLAQASMAYKHMGKNPGFMIISHPKAAAGAFAELYNRCGVSKCAKFSGKMFEMFAGSIFVTMAQFDLSGWPHADVLAQDKALMALGSKATREIMRLPQFGLAGKLFSLTMGPGMMARNNAKMEHICLPVDYSAFNKFHHGGKVREQDIQVLRDRLADGRAAGRAMPALSALLERYEAHIRT